MLAVGLAGAGSAARAVDVSGDKAFHVRVAGGRVHLQSSRWWITIEHALVIAVENRLTGEVYAGPRKGSVPNVPAGLGVETGAIGEAARLHGPWGTIDLKQGVTQPGAVFPSQHQPFGGSTLTVRRPDRHTVVLHYKGLAAGARRYPDETFALTARFDESTGDLVLESSGACPVGGVYGAAVGVVNLDKRLRASVSHMGGMTFDADWPKQQYSLGDGGPFLEGPVIALEGPRGGSMGVWAQDATFRPKNLFWQNTPEAFHLVWQTRNVMPFAPHKTARSVQWRLNCFRGSWVAALTPYRNWFHKAFAADIARRPAWAKRIRVIITQLPMDEQRMRRIAKVFDPATVLLHAWAARQPNFDTELPDFTPRESFIKSVAAAHKLGFRTSAYVNAVCINMGAKVTEAYGLRQNVLLRGKLFGSGPPDWR